jgi:sarcosine oxidase, subunit beta
MSCSKESVMPGSTLPSRARVVVIGGGVIGLSIAYHLAAAGVKDIVVLEQAELGSGSTDKCAGGVRASFSNETNLRMGMRGLEVYSQFADMFGWDVNFVRRGYLYTLTEPHLVDAFTEATGLQTRFDVGSRMISPEEACEISPPLSPDGLLAAQWSPNDALCSPVEVVSGYAQAARNEGVRILTNLAVTGLVMKGSAVAGVVTPGGTVACDTVICAAGAWSGRVGEMAGIDIPIAPLRRRTLFTGPLREGPPNPGPNTMDVATLFWFHTEGPGYLFGWNNSDEPEGFNLALDLEGWQEGLLEVAEARAPEFAEHNIASGWSGYYEVTPDHNQIIDRAVEVDGLIIAAGFSGHGFQMGPATGEIVRDIYLDREPGYDIKPFRATRFAEMATTAEAAII